MIRYGKELSPREAEGRTDGPARRSHCPANARLPLDDDDVGDRLGIDRHYVNQICRRLAQEGLTRRTVRPDGKLRNLWRGGGTRPDEPGASLSRVATSGPRAVRSVPGAAWPSTATTSSGQAFEEHVGTGFPVVLCRRGGATYRTEAKGTRPRPTRLPIALGSWG
jgi:hypothetical protein